MVISILLSFIFFFIVCYGNDMYLLGTRAITFNRLEGFCPSFNGLLAAAFD